eukprot:3756958-Pyramimonas_sp.AAC.1
MSFDEACYNLMLRCCDWEHREALFNGRDPRNHMGSCCTKRTSSTGAEITPSSSSADIGVSHRVTALRADDRILRPVFRDSIFTAPARELTEPGTRRAAARQTFP